MENTIVSDILIANEELLAAYEDLSQSERELNRLCNVMNNIQGAVETVTELGLDPEIKAILNQDAALENLCQLPINKITSEQALEGLKEAISEGAKRVWEGIKEVIAKIIEFLSKLFNTTNYQISEILKNPGRINFDKVVMTSTKLKIATLAQDCETLKNFVQKYINVQNVRLSSMQADLASMLAQTNILKRETNARNEWTGYVKIVEGLNFFEQMTLKDAGFTVNDITSICWKYRDKARSYTLLGNALHSVKNEVIMYYKADNIANDLTYSRYLDDGQALQDKLNGCVVIYRMDSSMYSVIAKLQSYLSKQIYAFFKAMDDSSITGVNKEEKSHVNEISYAA